MKDYDSEIAALRAGLTKILERGSLDDPDGFERGLCYAISRHDQGSRAYSFMAEFMADSEGERCTYEYIDSVMGLTPTRMNVVLLLLGADDDTLRYFYQQFDEGYNNDRRNTRSVYNCRPHGQRTTCTYHQLL